MSPHGRLAGSSRRDRRARPPRLVCARPRELAGPEERLLELVVGERLLEVGERAKLESAATAVSMLGCPVISTTGTSRSYERTTRRSSTPTSLGG